jgi:hypothetical protein
MLMLFQERMITLVVECGTGSIAPMTMSTDYDRIIIYTDGKMTMTAAAGWKTILSKSSIASNCRGDHGS